MESPQVPKRRFTLPRRHFTELLTVASLALLVIATWLPRMTGPLDLRWDGGVYYVLGTALAEGRGYRLLNEPGQIEATQYPPLFPAFIAAHQVIAGTTDPTKVGRWLRISSFFTSLAFVLASYALLRRHLPGGWAFVGAAMCALHTSTIFLSDIAFAEIPFALATILFFLWRRPGNTSLRSDLVAGALGAVAYLLRTAGVALLVAWVVEGALQRKVKQTALRIAITLLVVGGWQARIAAVENDPSYSSPSYPYQRAEYLFYNVSYARNVFLRDVERPILGQLSILELSDRFVRSLVTVPSRLGQAATATADDWGKQVVRLRKLPVAGRLARKALVDPLLMLLGILVLAGLVLQFKRRDRLMPLYVAAYIALLCLTPSSWESARYLLPIAPFLVLALWECGIAIRGWLQTGRWRGLAKLAQPGLIALAALILGIQVASLRDFFLERHRLVVYQDRNGALVSYRLLYYREVYQALDAGLDWLRQRARPTEIIASSMPHWAYLRTGLQAVMPPFERDPSRAQALLDSVPVSYLIVDGRTGSFTREYGLPAVKAMPGSWELVYFAGAGELEIYRRLRDGEPPGPVGPGSGEEDRAGSVSH
jgi:hypothetical protein